MNELSGEGGSGDTPDQVVDFCQVTIPLTSLDLFHHAHRSDFSPPLVLMDHLISAREFADRLHCFIDGCQCERFLCSAGLSVRPCIVFASPALMLGSPDYRGRSNCACVAIRLTCTSRQGVTMFYYRATAVDSFQIRYVAHVTVASPANVPHSEPPPPAFAVGLRRNMGQLISHLFFPAYLPDSEQLLTHPSRPPQDPADKSSIRVRSPTHFRNTNAQIPLPASGERSARAGLQ
jgi:hypothetical protein